ncbi:PASTA domain-containing protein [Actinopolymorpha pittospori]|uniref:Beta-lactam-binding protein with PASTA domain n=1 Tax=Actinopolymorpha pittospori TaxID=648752 RepID=A0A927MR24_9ACTN|nr:PASTA domain-containing protein [Actinopolymorpha pittospori]MBE1604529.1 beta-lactam-binding protein with PASTA domain [Actinopolymorpha pittospori]
MTWAITSAAERAELRPDHTVEVSFTVTNSGAVTDEAVFDVVPGDNAAATWFSVQRPHERVEPGKSVTFLAAVAIPPDTAAGSYWLQGRVYSASNAPEESSVLSNRVTFEVEAAPVRKARPWWLLAVAGLVVAVLAVGGFLLFRPKDVAVPDLTGAKTTLAQAREKLEGVGLTLGTVRYRQQPSDAGSVVQQSLTPNRDVGKGTPVDLIVGVSLPAPTLQSPGNGESITVDQAIPPLTWKKVEHAASYLVDVRRESCAFFFLKDQPRPCSFETTQPKPTDQTSFTPTLSFAPVTIDIDSKATIGPAPGKVGQNYRTSQRLAPIILRTYSGRVQWRVTAVDEFGNPGPPSEFVIFTKKLT